MSPMAIVLSAILAAAPGANIDRGAALKSYEAARAGAGRDAESQVRLALWCEAHGLDAQRERHLAVAVLTDPTNALARGLLGLVAYRGKWLAPEKAGAAIEADAAIAGKRAEYERRRERIEAELRRREDAARSRLAAIEIESGRAAAEASRRAIRRDLAPEHSKLGLWCEANGLPDEALAHLNYAVVLDPSREATWRHLGFVRRDGRWMTHDQAAAARKDDEARRQADRHWEPLLKTWRAALADPKRRDETRERLDAVDDPRAVPAILRVFNDEATAEVAVAMLARIDSPASTRGLIARALSTRSEAARSVAMRALRGRDLRDAARSLVDQIQSTMRLGVQRVGGPGVPGVMVIETPRLRMVRIYDAPPAFHPRDIARGRLFDISEEGQPIVVNLNETVSLPRVGEEQRRGALDSIGSRTAEMIAAADLKAADSQARLVSDIAEVEAINAEIRPRNARIGAILKTALDAPDLPDDEDAWHSWYYDRLGYRYDPPEQVTVTTDASPQIMPAQISDCFAAGTPVRTPDGRRPIESLRVGDLVLAQDTTTGALGYQPITSLHPASPTATLWLTLDSGETIVTIPYHRFWLAGKGWAMARVLKPGDVLRTLGGRAEVVSVSLGDRLPVYNLDVARSRTFFVGERDALVHDNSPPEPVLRPFDAEGP